MLSASPIPSQSNHELRQEKSHEKLKQSPSPLLENKTQEQEQVILQPSEHKHIIQQSELLNQIESQSQIINQDDQLNKEANQIPELEKGQLNYKEFNKTEKQNDHHKDEKLVINSELQNQHHEKNDSYLHTKIQIQNSQLDAQINHGNLLVNKSENDTPQQTLNEVNEQLLQFIQNSKVDNQSRVSNRQKENDQQNSQLSNKNEQQIKNSIDINNRVEQLQESKLQELSNSQIYEKQQEINENYYFDTEEKRLMIEKLNDRLQQLHLNIEQSYNLKDKYIKNEKLLKQKDLRSRWIEKQEENILKSNQIESEYIKERAYELLVKYHSELIILRQQKQVDNDEIYRLKQIVDSSLEENKILTQKIEELNNQLRSQNKLITLRDNIDLKQLEQVQNPQEISQELNQLKIRQAQSSYSFNKTSNLNESNSFLGYMDSPSPNQEISDNYQTLMNKNKENSESNTQTSFNISPSTKKKPIVIKKLQDSFYNNKKRFSLRKEQGHQLDLNSLNNENSNFYGQQNGQNIKIQNEQPQKVVIQLHRRNFINQPNQLDQRKSPSPLPGNTQNNGIIKPRQQRINSHKGNNLLEVNQNDPFWGQDQKQNEIEKANNKIKNIIKEQKSFQINQNNSLWVNSIDFGDLETQNELNMSKQINQPKEIIRQAPSQDFIDISYDPKTQQSHQKIKSIVNGRQISNDKKIGEKRQSQEKNTNSRVRKSYSINSSSNIKLDPINQQKQNLNNK